MNEHVNEVAGEAVNVVVAGRKPRDAELTVGTTITYADSNDNKVPPHLARTTRIEFKDDEEGGPNTLVFDWDTSSEETKKFYAHQGFSSVTRQAVTKDIRDAKKEKASKETILEILAEKVEQVRAFLAGDFSERTKERKAKNEPKINWDLLVRICRANKIGAKYEDDKALKAYLRSKAPNGLTIGEVLLHPQNTTYGAVREMYENEVKPVNVNEIELDL